MAILYLSAVEYIKKRPFDVNAPAYYFPHLPEEMKNPTVAKIERPGPFRMTSMSRKNPLPFRQTPDPTQMQLCSYTIEVMIEMFQKQIEFEIVNEDDIPEIFDAVDRYLLSLREDVAIGVEHIIEYAKLVVRWRTELYKHYYRYMTNHPAALEALYPNNDRKKNLVSLMSIGIRQENLDLDPLRSKAKPPYDIEEQQPKPTVIDGEDAFQMETSLGLSQNGFTVDDGSKFDFEDFLKRG